MQHIMEIPLKIYLHSTILKPLTNTFTILCEQSLHVCYYTSDVIELSNLAKMLYFQILTICHHLKHDKHIFYLCANYFPEVLHVEICLDLFSTVCSETLSQFGLKYFLKFQEYCHEATVGD